VPDADGVSCELYRRADRFITVTGRQIGNATKLARIDVLLDEALAELESTKKAAKQKKPEQRKQHDLDDIIKNGEGGHFDGHRASAVWYVINEMLRRERSADEIAAVLLDRSNKISEKAYEQSAPKAYVRKQIEDALAKRAEDPDAEIERLAKLTALEYEQQRKGAAEKLDVRASILDRLVRDERERLGLGGDDGKLQGNAVSFEEIEPWPEPVNGAELLDEIATTVRKHVVMSDYSRDICALWVVHSYLIKRFMISPKLSIRSAVKGFGKTTLLDVLSHLVFRALVTGSITKAALFRIIDMWHPTLLIDEVDSFVGDDEELRGMLNNSHRYDGAVVRTVGDEHEPRRFSIYAAVVLSGIGGLVDTLADRSVTTDLQRRRPSEPITQLRIGRMEHLHTLRRRIARWVTDHEDRIAERDPEMPTGVHNREADNWHVLLAIAAEAGGVWPERARKAAEASHSAESDDASRLRHQHHH
jgi:Protein of unknown function (DUF3631)